MMLAKRYPEQDGPSPERLVRSHMDLVRKIAWHLHGRVGRMAEIDDMLQVGYMGLVDAAQRYSPRQGATFAAYAAIRIRGSIIDYLRASSSLCRATIVMQQKMRASTQKLEQQLLRTPEKHEIATDMGLTVAELEDWETQFGASQIKSLDEVYTDHSLLFSDAARTVEDKMQQDEMRKMLRRALGQLPEREALVLQLYFVEELNVYEIAEILGVTTGRVSQIKKAAVGRLRESINAMEEE
ncbi:MAG: RNA polymerase sigma70 [Rhodobacter sp. CACIA14H1]|nr:MAG: RNA polymerase sigma70 [Rhodobacter sp. CACIA14H1]